MNKKKLIFLILVVGIAIIGFLFYGDLVRYSFAPTPSILEKDVAQEREPKFEDTRSAKDIEVIAENLQIPWEIVFLPGGDILVTERPGTLRRIGRNMTVIPIEGVKHIGEGGLLGMALHPDFTNNHWLYLYMTTKTDSGLQNRIERYRFEKNKLFDRTIIIENIPGAVYHDGGRIKFGPDGFLYVTTGDAKNPDSAQDIQSLAGKILRIKDDGSIPADNPFGNAVYTWGHRNPQGLAWDNEGRLWATEHGRSGILSGLDELNVIEKGRNYGWPIIQGDEAREGMVTPMIQSGPDDTWAPAGAAFWDGSIFFGGLRGESLYEAKIHDRDISIKMHFREQFGRIRAVRLGPDGFLYITTSNMDGRGTRRSGDDKIIRINPNIFR